MLASDLFEQFAAGGKVVIPVTTRGFVVRVRKTGSGSVREGSLSSFEMTDPLFCCHSERMRGIPLLFEIRAKLKLNHCRNTSTIEGTTS
jgi:hypothetical protein